VFPSASKDVHLVCCFAWRVKQIAFIGQPKTLQETKVVSLVRFMGLPVLPLHSRPP